MAVMDGGTAEDWAMMKARKEQDGPLDASIGEMVDVRQRPVAEIYREYRQDTDWRWIGKLIVTAVPVAIASGGVAALSLPGMTAAQTIYIGVLTGALANMATAWAGMGVSEKSYEWKKLFYNARLAVQFDEFSKKAHEVAFTKAISMADADIALGRMLDKEMLGMIAMMPRHVLEKASDPLRIAVAQIRQARHFVDLQDDAKGTVLEATLAEVVTQPPTYAAMNLQPKNKKHQELLRMALENNQASEFTAVDKPLGTLIQGSPDGKDPNEKPFYQTIDIPDDRGAGMLKGIFTIAAVLTVGTAWGLYAAWLGKAPALMGLPRKIQIKAPDVPADLWSKVEMYEVRSGKKLDLPIVRGMA